MAKTGKVNVLHQGSASSNCREAHRDSVPPCLNHRMLCRNRCRCLRYSGVENRICSQQKEAFLRLGCGSVELNQHGCIVHDELRTSCNRQVRQCGRERWCRHKQIFYPRDQRSTILNRFVDVWTLFPENGCAKPGSSGVSRLTTLLQAKTTPTSNDAWTSSSFKRRLWMAHGE